MICHGRPTLTQSVSKQEGWLIYSTASSTGGHIGNHSLLSILPTSDYILSIARVSGTHLFKMMWIYSRVFRSFPLKSVASMQWSASYQGLLDASHLSSLQTRRENARLVYMYKIIHKLIDFPDDPLHLKPAPPYSSRNRNPLTLKLCHCRTSKFLNSYFPRTSSRWNNLLAATVTSTSISSFKHALT